MNLLENMLWRYRAVFKQTAGGGGDIVVNIRPNTRMVLLYGTIGPNDYGGGRSLDVDVLDDEDDDVVIHLVDDTFTLDNITIPMTAFATPEAVPADQDIYKVSEMLVVSGKDRLRLILAAVQNEEFTLSLRALVKHTPPTVDTTDSTGTVTTTLAYDEVS